MRSETLFFLSAMFYLTLIIFYLGEIYEKYGFCAVLGVLVIWFIVTSEQRNYEYYRIYGVDIDEKNIIECTKRLSLGSNDETIWNILNHNIICADILKYYFNISSCYHSICYLVQRSNISQSRYIFYIDTIYNFLLLERNQRIL